MRHVDAHDAACGTPYSLLAAPVPGRFSYGAVSPLLCPVVTVPELPEPLPEPPLLRCTGVELEPAELEAVALWTPLAAVVVLVLLAPLNRPC
jgi:hypothetical protein